MEITNNSLIARKIHCMQTVAFIPMQDAYFALPDYRMIQNLEANCFLRCTRTEYNGRIKLVYFHSGCTPLSEMITGCSADQLLVLAVNILEAVLAIQENGFLKCSRIVLSPEYIYADKQTLTVKLLYLPFCTPSSADNEDAEAFSQNLEQLLLFLIGSAPALSGDIRGVLLREKLLQAGGSLQELHQYICGRLPAASDTPKPVTERPASHFNQETPVPGASYDPQKPEKSAESKPSAVVPPVQPIPNAAPAFQPKLVLRSITPSIRHSFVITKPRFEIGRNSSDGKADFSILIAKQHCVILYEDGRYYVMDLGSRSGTYVNNDARLPANDKVPLKNGDRLKLGNITFLVLL